GREPRSQWDLGHQGVHAELGKRRRQGAPAVVFEAVDRLLQRSLVGSHRSSPPESTKPASAATVGAGELHLSPASGAEWLLEEADASPASAAEPGAEGSTGATAGRQQPVQPPAAQESGTVVRNTRLQRKGHVKSACKDRGLRLGWSSGAVRNSAIMSRCSPTSILAATTSSSRPDARSRQALSLPPASTLSMPPSRGRCHWTLG